MTFYRTARYLKYLFTSRFRHGHSIHSPYLFGLITNVIENFGAYYSYELFEKAEESVRTSKGYADMSDLSAENGIKDGKCKIKLFSKYYDLSPCTGRLVFRLINEFRPEEVSVFGLTTGLNLLYTSRADSRIPVRLFTEKSLPGINITEFVNEHRLNNVVLKGGDSEQSFHDNRSVFSLVNYPFSPKKSSAIAADFLDKVKDGSVIILRGIHNSDEMGIVWKDIKLNKKISVSLELFNMGIGISMEKLQKQNFVFRFKPFMPLLRSLYT